MKGKIGRPKKVVTPSLVPESVFTTLNWWDKLDAKEQQVVKTEGEQLAVALLNNGRSRLAIGEHLLNIKTVLEPRKLFVKFLKNFHFSVKTAYRYMNGYENVKSRVAEPILTAAMARGINMIGESTDKPFGIYTEAARQLPPPVITEMTPEQANTWLDSVETVRKKVRSTASTFTAGVTQTEPQDPEVILKECFRFVENRFKKLPANSRIQQSFIKRLMSYEASLLGGTSSITVAPTAAPSDYHAERGRPRLVTAPAAAAA